VCIKQKFFNSQKKNQPNLIKKCPNTAFSPYVIKSLNFQ
jgi:hypothetical protein